MITLIYAVGYRMTWLHRGAASLKSLKFGKSLIRIGASRVTKRIEEAMTDIRDALPEGIELDDKLFRQERFIHASIDNVVVAIRDAGILALSSWRCFS